MEFSREASDNPGKSQEAAARREERLAHLSLYLFDLLHFPSEQKKKNYIKGRGKGFYKKTIRGKSELCNYF